MEKYITLIVKDSQDPELEVEEKFQIYTTKHRIYKKQ